jgi:integrase
MRRNAADRPRVQPPAPIDSSFERITGETYVGRPGMRHAREAYLERASLLPMQFPSLQHFLERADAVYIHARQVEGLSTKTIEGYRATVRRFATYLRDTRTEVAFLSGQLPAQVRVLEDWIAWLRSAGANHTTVNHYWRTLHAVLHRIARADGVLVPTGFVATPRPGRAHPRFLSRTALEDVFAFVRNHEWPFGSFERTRNVALIAVMSLGGLRLGEVLRLEFGDIDLVDGRIRVRNGKGTNGGKDRTVYMAPVLGTALAAYVDARRKRRATTTKLFLSTRGGGPMARVAVRRLCTIVTKRSGIKIAPHMLRHTCATLLRQAGIADRLAMDQLGHQSLHVLQRYSHVENGELQREIGRLTIDVDAA